MGALNCVPVPRFVCPICKGPLDRFADGFRCAQDRREYRTVSGMLDFRVFSDSDVQFDPEEAKAPLLAAEYPYRTFAALVDFYYSVTPEVSPDLARRYTRHVMNGPARAEHALTEIERHAGPTLRRTLLEIGCGSGGFLVAAAPVFQQIVGIDVAPHWLIVARKRLEEAGREAVLVCACAECLPFADVSFDLVVGSDVIEHTAEQAKVVREACRVVAENGSLFLATPNRWSLAPEPHVKLFGVGFLPEAWRNRYVRLVRGIAYESIHPLNYFDIKRLISESGCESCQVLLPELTGAHASGLSRWGRMALPAYHLMRRLPILNGLLYLFGPLFHLICVKSSRGQPASHAAAARGARQAALDRVVTSPKTRPSPPGQD